MSKNPGARMASPKSVTGGPVGSAFCAREEMSMMRPSSTTSSGSAISSVGVKRRRAVYVRFMGFVENPYRSRGWGFQTTAHDMTSKKKRDCMKARQRIGYAPTFKSNPVSVGEVLRGLCTLNAIILEFGSFHEARESFIAPSRVGEWLSLVEHLVRDRGSEVQILSPRPISCSCRFAPSRLKSVHLRWSIMLLQ